MIPNWEIWRKSTQTAVWFEEEHWSGKPKHQFCYFAKYYRAKHRNFSIRFKRPACHLQGSTEQLEWFPDILMISDWEVWQKWWKISVWAKLTRNIGVPNWSETSMASWSIIGAIKTSFLFVSEAHHTIDKVLWNSTTGAKTSWKWKNMKGDAKRKKHRPGVKKEKIKASIRPKQDKPSNGFKHPQGATGQLQGCYNILMSSDWEL